MGLFGFGKKRENPLPGAPLQTSHPQTSSQPAYNSQSQQLPSGPVLQNEPSQLFSHSETQSSPPMPVQTDDLSAQIESVPTAQPQEAMPPVTSAPMPNTPQEFSVPDFSDDDLDMTASAQMPSFDPVPSGPVQSFMSAPQEVSQPIAAPAAPAVPAARATSESSFSEQLYYQQNSNPDVTFPKPHLSPVQTRESQDAFRSLSQESESQSSISLQEENYAESMPAEQMPPVPEDDRIEAVTPEPEESGDEFGFTAETDDQSDGLSFAPDEELSPIMPEVPPASDFSEQIPVQETQVPVWTPQPEYYASPAADFSVAPTQTQIQEPLEPIEKKVFVQRDRGKTNVFVEKEAYEEALLSMIAIEEDVSKAADHLGRVIDDESIVSSRMKEWHDVMNEIQEKLIAADTRIFDTGDNDG